MAGVRTARYRDDDVIYSGLAGVNLEIPSANPRNPPSQGTPHAVADGSKILSRCSAYSWPETGVAGMAAASPKSKPPSG